MRKFPFAILTAVFLFSASAFADTVTLTNGDKVEGKITSETPDAIAITVQVSASITDERTISRDEIKSVAKATQDDIAFEEIKNLKPDPTTSFSPATYEEIFTKLNAFIAQFPDSPHTSDVKAILGVFQKEKEHLDTGEIKFYGRWISKEEAAKRAAQVEAQPVLLTMKSKAAEGDLIGALNAFDSLEKTYNTTRAWPQAVELAKHLIPALSSRVNSALDKINYDTQTWKNGPSANDPQIIAARKTDQTNADAMFEAAQKNPQKWPLFIPRSEKSLAALKTLIPAESTRISALPLDKMTSSLQCVDKAIKAISGNDTAAAGPLLSEAATLWPQNEAAAYWQKILADRKSDEEAKTAAQAATPVITPTPTPSTDSIPASTPAQDDGSKKSPVAFFQTITGALTLAGGALVILGIVSLIQKLKKKPENEE